MTQPLEKIKAKAMGQGPRGQPYKSDSLVSFLKCNLGLIKKRGGKRKEDLPHVKRSLGHPLTLSGHHEELLQVGPTPLTPLFGFFPTPVVFSPIR